MRLHDILLEGGKVVPGSIALTKRNLATVKRNLKNYMPRGIKVHPIGSGGHKDVSHDLDVLIDANELFGLYGVDDPTEARKKLEDHFKSKGLFAKRNGVMVHVGIPTNDGHQVQVDIMAVQNVKVVAPLHQHDYSQDPTMKGGTLHAVWADLANLTPYKVSLKMSPYRGLMNRKTNELITSSKDEIAKIIVGPKATADDLSSLTKLKAALQKYAPEKWTAVAKYWAV